MKLNLFFKDATEGIDEHFINTLTQNFILQLDQEYIDLDKLMDQHNILLDTGNSP